MSFLPESGRMYLTCALTVTDTGWATNAPFGGPRKANPHPPPIGPLISLIGSVNNRYVPRAEVLMKSRKWLIILVTILTLIPAHGYLATSILLLRNAARDGVYPTRDKAIDSTLDNLAYYEPTIPML